MVRIATNALKSRSALKTATYGIMHLTVAFLVAYALTGSVAIALSIGLIEPFVQTIFYNIHETLWSKAGEPRKPHNHGLAA
ncbi:DUF2061 domain-containing protein [Parvularcula flava]|uniref:DUF2061 domain-containing protein n=1 Tax=Aquisalinus luteolus TaxID=1566827 RepID=A0A8J3ERE5_9PROT|nr:DUF2061 domain-containing protein [Aquisalinus luteolus]NHK28017.1 DUF2061 domain-containing protein [Aquisalinus luteolus]GGH97215.1 hypothetical protein GCM10011355_17890 [Aquisalinus luteolus]